MRKKNWLYVAYFVFMFLIDSLWIGLASKLSKTLPVVSMSPTIFYGGMILLGLCAVLCIIAIVSLAMDNPLPPRPAETFNDPVPPDVESRLDDVSMYEQPVEQEPVSEEVHEQVENYDDVANDEDENR